MRAPELIRALRLDMGLTQTEFAKRIHVTTATVNRWENGRNAPHLSAIKKIKAVQTYHEKRRGADYGEG